MMPLRRALGFEPCRYPEPIVGDIDHCRYCGRPIRWVSEYIAAGGVISGYWAHRPSRSGANIRTAERGSEPLATSNPPQRATKLSLSEVDVECSSGVDAPHRTPLAALRSPQRFHTVLLGTFAEYEAWKATVAA